MKTLEKKCRDDFFFDRVKMQKLPISSLKTNFIEIFQNSLEHHHARFLDSDLDKYGFSRLRVSRNFRFLVIIDDVETSEILEILGFGEPKSRVNWRNFRNFRFW